VQGIVIGVDGEGAALDRKGLAGFQRLGGGILVAGSLAAALALPPPVVMVEGAVQDGQVPEAEMPSPWA
jgi:hypothetical protein